MPSRVHVSEGNRQSGAEVDGGTVRLLAAGRTFVIRPLEEGRFVVDSGSLSIKGTAVRRGPVVWVSIDGARFEIQVGIGGRRRSAFDPDTLSSPMPATVTRVAVEIGQRVESGDLLIALEAMKMELPIRAPHEGIVRAVHCHEGELVAQGMVLVELSDTR
jgi:3-methylcrotonyl-CoA carboxylase alpha subunit